MCCIGKDCASWHDGPLPYQTCSFSAFSLTLSCDFNENSWLEQAFGTPVMLHSFVLLSFPLLWLLEGPLFSLLCLLILKDSSTFFWMTARHEFLGIFFLLCLMEMNFLRKKSLWNSRTWLSASQGENTGTQDITYWYKKNPKTFIKSTW